MYIQNKNKIYKYCKYFLILTGKQLVTIASIFYVIKLLVDIVQNVLKVLFIFYTGSCYIKMDKTSRTYRTLSVSIYLFNFLAERIQVHLVSVERRLKRAHLVEQAAQRPDVRLEVVSVFVNPLRRHVVRCSHQGVGCRRLRGEEAAQAEIPQLYHALRRYKHVGRLYI